MDKINYSIIKSGLFDSATKFPNTITTADRILDHFEIELFTCDYSGTSYINDIAHRLEKGLLIFAKPGQRRHSLLHFKCCYLHLTVESPELYELFSSMPDTLHVANYEELATLFFKMSAMSNESITDSLFWHSCADRILYTAVRLSKNRSVAISTGSGHINTLLSVKNYIKNNFSESITLDVLAKASNLSPVYLHKLFTEYYGQTPAEYTQQVRISAAKQLLLATNDSILKIAMDCGFSSQSYFSSSFKKHTGMSPVSYRRKMLSQIDI